MAVSSDDRVRGFVNVYREGPASNIWPTRDGANRLAGSSRVRLAECHELREGESIVTAEMRREIEAFTGDMWPKEVRDAATAILGILDGEKS